MPFFNEFSVEEFAPKAWAGICNLVGGSDRVDSNASTWKDGFIVNLGTNEAARSSWLARGRRLLCALPRFA